MGSVIRKSSKESSIYKFAGAGDIRRVLRLQTEDATATLIRLVGNFRAALTPGFSFPLMATGNSDADIVR
jgi:hypothetical protein